MDKGSMHSQIEYPLGGSSKKGSHIYFMLQVFRVILLFDINVLLSPWWSDVTIVQSDITILGNHVNYQQEVNMATYFVTAP